MKKMVCMLLALLAALLCACAAMAEDAVEYPMMPDALQFTQKYTRTKPREDTTLIHFYPTTAREEVDAAIRGIMDGMDENAAAFLPKGGKKKDITRVTVGPVIGRSGTKWMSFLTLCTVSTGSEQVYVEYDARAYDMETGAQLTLCDLFAPDSAAWEVLQREVRAQLTDYFMTEEPDAEALDALCTREAIEQTPFTFTAGTLMLHYRADALYPGHNTLMHVRILFPALWDMMTEKAARQTDNRAYRLVALTFDDGCAKSYSLTVGNLLQQYGANATFFVIGESLASNRHVLSYEHDAGFSIGSHNYKHVYDNLQHDKLLDWKQKADEAMDSVIGIRPQYMRAPGGVQRPYIHAGVGLPMIHWDVISGDGEGDKPANEIMLRVINNAHDGAIVLMHDANKLAGEYLAWILPILQERGCVFVSVEELLALRNIPLEPGYIYYSANEAPEKVE